MTTKDNMSTSSKDYADKNLDSNKLAHMLMLTITGKPSEENSKVTFDAMHRFATYGMMVYIERKSEESFNKESGKE